MSDIRILLFLRSIGGILISLEYPAFEYGFALLLPDTPTHYSLCLSLDLSVDSLIIYSPDLKTVF